MGFENTQCLMLAYVDDDDPFRDYIPHILEQGSKFRVIRAKDGNNILEILDNNDEREDPRSGGCDPLDWLVAAVHTRLALQPSRRFKGMS